MTSRAQTTYPTKRNRDPGHCAASQQGGAFTPTVFHQLPRRERLSWEQSIEAAAASRHPRTSARELKQLGDGLQRTFPAAHRPAVGVKQHGMGVDVERDTAETAACTRIRREHTHHPPVYVGIARILSCHYTVLPRSVSRMDS